MDFITLNIIVYTISSFLTIQSWCLSSTFHSKNIETDDFINILLKSEKFNDLIDVIAEKAAKKIQYLNDNKAKQYVTKKNNASNETENAAEDTFNESEEQNIYKKEYNVQEVKYRNEYAKLNPQTFIQIDASLPSDKLLLKFKHLTGDVHNTINSNKQTPEIHTEKYHNSNENNVKYSQKLNIYSEQRQNKTNKISKMVTSSEYRNLNMEEEKNKGTEKIKEEKKLRTIIQSGEQIYSAQGQKHVREVSDIEREHDEIKKDYLLLTANGQPEIIDQSKKQDKETDSEDFVTKTKSDINKKRNQQLSEEESKGSKNDITKTNHGLKYSGERPHYDTVNNDNFDEHKENVESEENLSGNKEFKLKKQKTKRLRKEGNKVFTFESSPDYDEYHEKNANVFY